MKSTWLNDISSTPPGQACFKLESAVKRVGGGGLMVASHCSSPPLHFPGFYSVSDSSKMKQWWRTGSRLWGWQMFLMDILSSWAFSWEFCRVPSLEPTPLPLQFPWPGSLHLILFWRVLPSVAPRNPRSRLLCILKVVPSTPRGWVEAEAQPSLTSKLRALGAGLLTMLFISYVLWWSDILEPYWSWRYSPS